MVNSNIKINVFLFRCSFIYFIIFSVASFYLFYSEIQINSSETERLSEKLGAAQEVYGVYLVPYKKNVTNLMSLIAIEERFSLAAVNVL